MQRIKIIDSIRGLCIILMIFHHTTFLMENFGFFESTLCYKISVNFLNSSIYGVIHFFYVSLFFIIAGITSNFSKNNFKRCLPVFGVALAVSIVTFIIMPSEYIRFGVLHCMGVCILCCALINKFFKNFFEKIPLFVWAILFLIGYCIYNQAFTIKPITVFGIELPTYIIGLPTNMFSSVDYFPIFPWIFAFFAGVSLGIIIKKLEIRPHFFDISVPVLSFVGKYPLFIYAIHQPIALAILFSMDKLI